MIILAIETSCDETSAAVIRNGFVISNIVASQIDLHSDYGGVVPELATREHLRRLKPVVETALHQGKMAPSQLDAVAATQGPGLPGALLIGLKHAQALAFALRKPFVGIHHHEAHLYSPWISGQPLAADFAAFQPSVSLVVSGGHTMLVHVTAELEQQLLGSTVDDAAGECFDKIAKLIGLGYPGGAALEKLATGGHAEAFDFPRPMIHDPNDAFSFAGLKTSVRYFLQKRPELPGSRQGLRDLAASVQEAIVDVLVTKTIRAARRLRVACVTASGGVTCNNRLRAKLKEECGRWNLALRVAEASLCTDNAAMIGILAERKLLAGKADTPLDAEIAPNWEL